MSAADDVLAKYRGLYMPPDMIAAARSDPEHGLDMCNGVGSDVGLLGAATYHLIPSTIYFLDITSAADIHDFMYSRKSGTLADKDEADRVFLNNMLRLVEMDQSWCGRRLAGLRRARAHTYYLAVQRFGGPSFWEGKNTVDGGVLTKQGV